MRGALFACVLVASCIETAPPYGYDLVGMKGKLRRYHVSCTEDVSNCWQGAREACRGDYVIEDREGRVRPGGLERYEGDMLVVCEKPQ